MKKKAHTRAANERKEKVTSIRLSQEQQQKIKENADKAKMPFSTYIVNTAMNGGNKLTPAALVELQNLINTACDAVKQNAPEKIQEMQEGAFQLWQKLI